jgi:hypothetical protein
VRTLRLYLVGMVILVLLGGLGGAVAAQDDPMAPAMVTGTATMLSHDPPLVSVPVGAIVSVGVGFTHRWEASDPRLSGTSTYTGSWLEYPSAELGVDATTRVVENDEGRWVGTSTALTGPDISTGTVILRGEGAYEGLTAYVLMDWHPLLTPQATFTAAIFPGEMPPFPELSAE